MNKKIKMLTTALLLSGSLLSAVPVHAATTTENQTKKVSTESSKSKIDGKVTKPSGDITVKAISRDQPSNGFSGTLWCTGDDVMVRYEAGQYADETMDRGDSKYFYKVSNGKAYFTFYSKSMDSTINLYVSTKYLSTKRVY